MAVYYALKYNQFNKKYLLYNFIFVVSILLLDGFYQYFSGYNILNYKWDGDRLSSLFGEEKIAIDKHIFKNLFNIDHSHRIHFSQ